MKRFRNISVFLVLAALCLILSVSVTASSSETDMVPGTASSVVTVKVRGNYYANCQEALDRLNAIRLEACREGIRNPADTSKKLTMNDYRPLKWSESLERVARLRAAEATLKRGHERPDGQICETADNYDVQTSYEILAWNDTQDLVVNIDQFYEEKDAWVYQTGEKSGHYVAIVDPRNTYVGCGGFYSPECCSYVGAMCARFTFETNVSNTSFGSPTDTVMIPINVLSSHIAAPRIVDNADGTASLHLGSSTLFEMWSETQFGEIYGKVYYKDNVSWSSSNPDVAKVSGGKVTTVSMGKTKITAVLSSGASASVDLEVTAPDVIVRLSKNQLNLEPGNSFQLNATVYPKNTPYNKVVWKNFDSTVASLSGGKITAKKAGKTVITATAMSGDTAKCVVTVTNPPASITLNKTKLVLGIGETSQLSATLPPDSTPGIKWTTSDSSVVTVSEGNLTAKGRGRAKVTAETTNGKTAVCEVEVKLAPSSLKMSYTEKAIGLGETYTLKASVPSGTASGKISWKSSNSKYVSVTNGKIKALQIGSVTVTATTYNGKTATCSVRVREAATSLSLDAETKTIGVGEKITLTPIIPKGTASGMISWTSGNTSVLTVSEGVVNALSTGTATVTAATFNGRTARCTITVKEAPSIIELDNNSAVLGTGETMTLNTYLSKDSASDSITWTSSDESIVSVNDGNITALKNGTALVTVRTFNGKTAECNVTVKNAPSDLILTETKMIVGVGEQFRLGAVIDRGSASKITWTTKNNDVIALDNGKVTALKEGTAVVTAKTFNRLSAICAVVVRKAPEYVCLNQQAVTLGAGEEFDLEAVMEKDSASSVLNWTSDDPDVVSVEDGRLYAKSQGRAVISVSTYNGLTAYCSVYVQAAPEYISLDTLGRNLGMNEKFQLEAVLPEGTASSLTWESSNEDVVTVKDGKVTTIGEGNAVVTVRAFNGVSSSCRIVVKSAPESITLSSEKIYIGAGETFWLYANIPEGSASAINWSISNENIALVEHGQVYGLCDGITTLSVKTYNGKIARCTIVVKSAPQYIELSETEKNIGSGETYLLTASVEKNSASANTEWFSSDESIVTVDNGKIIGLSTGTAVIGVRTYNGMMARCVINVKSAPQSFKLSEKKIILGEGETFNIQAVFDGDSASGTINWSSSSKKAASVSDGTIKGLASGATRITAQTYNGITATCSVIVRSAPEEVTLSSEKLYMGVGETYKLTASLPSGSMSALSWKIGNTDIASVENGTITAHKEGNTTVTVKTFNGKTANCLVVVKAEPNEVSLNADKKILGIGEKITLTAQLPKGSASAGLKWASGNTSVAKVLSDGTVKAIGKGSTTIAVRTYNGLRAVMKVTVRSAPRSITLSKTKKYLGIGEKYQLKAIFPSGTASDTMIWTSSDSDIASVENGTITALKNGTAVITAKTFNGITASCKVIVKNAPDEVFLDMEEIILGEGETATLTASVTEGSSSDFTWSIGNPDFASVSNGKITALSAGRTRVTVRTYNGKTTPCLVIVKIAPTDISTTDEEITLAVGQTFQPNIVMTKNSASALTWRTSDSSVATVQDGIITAVSEGTAIISVFTFNGYYTECLVIVGQDAV